MKLSEAKETAEPKCRGQTALSADDIYERILTAVMERRLKPGVQLIEERLAKVFDVSRTKVRQAISRLIPIPCHLFLDSDVRRVQVRVHNDRMASGICVDLFHC
jgi:hypothetical protein